MKQLELEMWRARAADSHRVAEIKDVLSVIAAWNALGSTETGFVGLYLLSASFL